MSGSKNNSKNQNGSNRTKSSVNNVVVGNDVGYTVLSLRLGVSILVVGLLGDAISLLIGFLLAESKMMPHIEPTIQIRIRI